MAGPPEIFTDYSAEFSELKQQLPADISAKLAEAQRDQDPKQWSRGLPHRWILCEMPAGQYPLVHDFETLPELLQALAALENQETAAVITYGAIIPFSVPIQKPNGKSFRYVLLPNSTATLAGVDEPFQVIEQSLLPEPLLLQPHHWLGDPEELGSDYYVDAESTNGDSHG
jgi:hypothetical protein